MTKYYCHHRTPVIDVVFPDIEYLKTTTPELQPLSKLKVPEPFV